MPRKKSETIDLKQWVETHGTDFVIKVRGGRPYIARKPKRDPARKRSADEIQQVNLFKLAVQYAREVRSDPEKAKEYEQQSQKEGRSIYHLAIADYIAKNRSQATEYAPLTFEDIVLEKTGKHLFLKVVFPAPVAFKKMEVTLFEMDKTPVEFGAAEQATVTSWWYLVQNQDIAGLPFRAHVKAENDEGTVFKGEKIVV